MLLISLSLLFGFALAARNEREEAICQPFLTSRATSPLVPGLKRNLSVDEDGEFSCELVLQDEQLPVQIRVTIHEGLGWLAVRHIQMGEQRQSVAARHFRLLSELIPTSLDFAWKASSFLMDPNVADPQKAAKYLHNALYGKASQDKAMTSDLKYSIRSLYAKALGQLQRYEEAHEEYMLLNGEHPFDFESAAMLSQPSEVTIQVSEAVQSQAGSEYTGFAPTNTKSLTVSTDGNTVDSQLIWQPQVFSRLLSEQEFLGFVQRREPFLIRFGTAQNLSSTLGWGTQAWRGEAGRIYLQEKVGKNLRLLVETRPQQSDKADPDGKTSIPTVPENFGFSLNARRKVMNFADALKADFTNAHGNESIYLNIQPPDPKVRDEVYRAPLHLLKDDLPLPTMLHAVEQNLTEINLWMGVARDRDSQSKLHMDATDNLYVMLEGRKHFAIAAPSEAPRMRTVSPTYAVSPDGLSFQFNPRKFAAYVRRRAQLATQAANEGNNTSGNAEVAVGGKTFPFTSEALQNHLLRHEAAEYEVLNYHFSLLDAGAGAADVSGVPHFTHFDLQEGDMLYLPTGWFHQVTSKEGRHMAVNYWWRALNWRNAVQYEREQSEALFEKLLA